MSDIYGITVENLMSVFPPSLAADSRVRALAEATATLLVGRLFELPLADLYGHLDALPEEVLDVLAKDFNIAWYDKDADRTTKARLIKDAFYVYRHIGTKSAVLTVLGSLYEGSTLEEWFEYGGAPYTCRISLGNGDQFCDTDVLKEQLENIDLYKNLRTSIESVHFDAVKSTGVYVGSALLYQEAETLTVSGAWDTNDDVYLADENDYYLTDGSGNLLIE